MELKILKIDKSALLPEYAHPGDSGMDLYSVEEKVLEPGQSALVKTGIKIELPQGTEAQIRPRSGLALKNSVTVLNSPGTIDQGYTGEICIILINHGRTAFKIEKFMKIAQMVIMPVIRVKILEVNKLSESSRGEGGFGSTGM